MQLQSNSSGEKEEYIQAGGELVGGVVAEQRKAQGSGHWQGLSCTNKKAETEIIDVYGTVKLFGDIFKPSSSKKHGQNANNHT